ncbi:MAG: hypothetical protein WC483_00340 [Candidatus Paceibacterota bacterium]
MRSSIPSSFCSPPSSSLPPPLSSTSKKKSADHHHRRRRKRTPLAGKEGRIARKDWGLLDRAIDRVEDDDDKKMKADRSTLTSSRPPPAQRQTNPSRLRLSVAPSPRRFLPFCPTSRSRGQ